MTDKGPTPEASRSLDAFLGRKEAGGGRRRRWWFIGAGVVGLIVVVMVVLNLGRPPASPYVADPVKRGDLVLSVSATGNLRATRQIEVGSETSGQVAQVFVDANDRVERGQPLARLDTARLVDSLNQAQAALAQARAQVRVSEASEREAEDLLARREAVAAASGGRVPSERELEESRSALARARADTLSARAQVDQATAEVSSARINLAKATLYSPVSGTVLTRQIEPGQTVAASFQTPVLFIIAEDLSQMILDVEVDEADIGQVEAGQSAVFTVDAFPGERFPATVERVNMGASNLGEETSQNNAVVSYVARLGVRNGDGRLRPGMTATSTIVTQRLRNVLIVPAAALRFQPPADAGPRRLSFTPPAQEAPSTQEAVIGRGSRQTVRVLQADGSLKAVDVEVVAISGAQAAVRGDGLEPGQSVVTGLRRR